MLLGRLVKCAFCGRQVDKDVSVRYRDKNYHSDCAEEAKNRDELGQYIVDLFHLKAPGPRNYAMIKKFYEENHFTYKGMLYSLKYFYEIKNNPIDKANQSIGIIPWVYEEAKEYFERIVNKTNTLTKIVSEQMEKEEPSVEIKVNKRKANKAYDLNSFNIEG